MKFPENQYVFDYFAFRNSDEKETLLSDFSYLGGILKACPVVLRHFRDFGIITYDEADEVIPTSYGSPIDAFTTTMFGITLARACDIRRFTWVNRWEEWILSLDEDAEEIELFEKEYQKNQPGTIDPVR